MVTASSEAQWYKANQTRVSSEEAEYLEIDCARYTERRRSRRVKYIEVEQRDY